MIDTPPDAEPGRDGRFPWEEEPPESGDPDSQRQRHDAFTEAKKCRFLEALVKTGCVVDACRLTGTAPSTVYRHQESDPRFLRHCGLALRMAAAPVELTAWERAVEGVEEEIAVGGKLVRRRRYSEPLLRLLLQGSNPKKYGRNPGFKRKRLRRHERRQMERQLRAEIAAEAPTFEESIVKLDKALVAFGVRNDQAKLDSGWTRTAEGQWVPPGYGPIPGWAPPPSAGDGTEGPGDCV